MSFYCRQPAPQKPFPNARRAPPALLRRRSMLGRQLPTWIRNKTWEGKFWWNLMMRRMKAFGMYHNAIFVAPSLWPKGIFADSDICQSWEQWIPSKKYYGGLPSV